MEIVFWPLFVTFAAIAIGATIKAVEASHGKKLADDECTRLRAQLEALNNPNNKGTIEVQALITPEPKKLAEPRQSTAHDARLEEMREKVLLLVVGREGLETSQIQAAFSGSEQTALFHLQELEKLEYVSPTYVAGSTWAGTEPAAYTWAAGNAGLTYLHKHGLLN